jgi:thiaminase/transcriptional activator TenA
MIAPRTYSSIDCFHAAETNRPTAAENEPYAPSSRGREDSIVTETFSESMRRECSAIWDAQLSHPFVVALADGTLPRETFQFYILQDARFLTDLAKVFAFAATKTDDGDRMLKFGELLMDTVRVERALHEMYAVGFGLTVEQMAATPMAPATYAYTRHMLLTAATGSLAETVTVTLPCAWIYAVIAEHFTALGEPAADHPYRDWLAMYANPDFAAVGEWLRSIVDDEAERMDDQGRQRLRDIFRTSSEYEWLFWQMAWTREAWPGHGSR